MPNLHLYIRIKLVESILDSTLFHSCSTKQKCSMCNIKDTCTSIKHQISSQSTSMLKGCMYVLMFDIRVVDTPFSYGRILIANFIRKFPKQRKVLCVLSKMHILHFAFLTLSGRFISNFLL